MASDKPPALLASFTEALSEQGPTRPVKLAKATEDLRLQMEAAAAEVRDLILAQPPLQLLGYLSAQLHSGVLAGIRQEGDDYRPDKGLIKKFQFAMEYAHAVWAGHANLKDEKEEFDEALAKQLFVKLGELDIVTARYCMISSIANRSEQSSPTELHAKTSWVFMRGHRYQLLEEEFFRYMLAPHDAALRAAYGMGASDVAAGIQNLADMMRTGMSEAARDMHKHWDRAKKLADETGEDMAAVIGRMKVEDPDFEKEMSEAMNAMFYGGTSNLSKHSKFSPALLEDISYEPGGNTDFFAEGEYKGTPMRTLPARVRPGIKLGGEYYATDPQFIRDSLYRSIQRGLIARRPDYKVPWDNGQKKVTENAYPAILATQFADAQTWTEVFFKDVTSGQWVETDLVMRSNDVLLVVEAKAGVMAMHSPATDFDKHERTIRKLIIEAYEQCKRFVEYLTSAPEVAIHNRIEGKYIEVGRLRYRDLRLVLPVGLTVEAFTPFSAMCKELKEIGSILGKHPFISMSVDDLFVLNRFLPKTGQLLHYLEVRQQAAGIPQAMIFDEIEHLGSYIIDNRFDMTLREHLKKVDRISWDSFGDIVDKHFEDADFESRPVPQQRFPDSLAAILDALDKFRPTGWLEADAHIRDMSGEAKDDLAGFIDQLLPTLSKFPVRRMLFSGNAGTIQIWLCRDSARPTLAEIKYQAEVASLLSKAPKVSVLRISYGANGVIDIECGRYGAPSILQMNYAELQSEAERQRMKSVMLGKAGKRKKR